MQNPNTGASAFMGLVLTVAFMGLVWVGLHALLRRFLGDRIVVLDRVLYFLFALGFNAAVFYLSVALCTAGLQQFLAGMGTTPRVLSWLLELVTGIPGQAGLRPQELLGLMIGFLSLLIAHLLYRSVIELYEWLESGLLPSLALNRAQMRNTIRMDQPDLDDDTVLQQAEFRTRWFIGWQTAQRVFAALAMLVVFGLVVYGFDVLLLQIQLADMMGLTAGEGNQMPDISDIPSVREMLAEHGNTAAVLVLKGLTWFYLGLLLSAAYVLHVSYHGVHAILTPDETQQDAGQDTGDEGGGVDDIPPSQPDLPPEDSEGFSPVEDT